MAVVLHRVFYGDTEDLVFFSRDHQAAILFARKQPAIGHSSLFGLRCLARISHWTPPCVRWGDIVLPIPSSAAPRHLLPARGEKELGNWALSLATARTVFAAALA